MPNYPARFPVPSVRRLPVYLRLLKRRVAEGERQISSTAIAAELDLDPTQVRKDIALVRVTGTPRVGYPTAKLILAIERFLGWDRLLPAALVGVGNLGRALLGYNGFASTGIAIVAAFDTDPAKAGMSLHGRTILPMSSLASEAKRHGVRLGIIATPAVGAQAAVERLVALGIRGVWNFTPVRLETPSNVAVENVDLSTSFAALSFRLAQSKR